MRPRPAPIPLPWLPITLLCRRGVVDVDAAIARGSSAWSISPRAALAGINLSPCPLCHALAGTPAPAAVAVGAPAPRGASRSARLPRGLGFVRFHRACGAVLLCVALIEESQRRWRLGGDGIEAVRLPGSAADSEFLASSRVFFSLTLPPCRRLKRPDTSVAGCRLPRAAHRSAHRELRIATPPRCGRRGGGARRFPGSRIDPARAAGPAAVRTQVEVFGVLGCHVCCHPCVDSVGNSNVTGPTSPASAGRNRA